MVRVHWIFLVMIINCLNFCLLMILWKVTTVLRSQVNILYILMVPEDKGA